VLLGTRRGPRRVTLGLGGDLLRSLVADRPRQSPSCDGRFDEADRHLSRASPCRTDSSALLEITPGVTGRQLGVAVFPRWGRSGVMQASLARQAHGWTEEPVAVSLTWRTAWAMVALAGSRRESVA